MSNSDEKLNKSGWFPTPPWRFTMRFISMARYRDVGAVGAAVQVGPLSHWRYHVPPRSTF